MKRITLLRLPLLGLGHEEIEQYERRFEEKSDQKTQLKKIWTSLWQRYFPERNDLEGYEVLWSVKPQKRTLASCSLSRKRVTVARELQPADHLRWLEPLLYHEMCHAVLGLSITRDNGTRAWHGKEFKELESKHHDMAAFQEWIEGGGWRRAVRSDRARRSRRRD